MKKTSILTIIMAFIAMGAFAQTPAAQAPAQAPGSPQSRPMPTAEERAKRTTDYLNTKVQLTPEQTKKIEEINKDFYTKMDALRTPGQPPSEESREKMRTLAKEKEDKVNNILTAEQKAKWEEARKAGPGMRGAPNGAPGATPAPAPGK